VGFFPEATGTATSAPRSHAGNLPGRDPRADRYEPLRSVATLSHRIAMNLLAAERRQVRQGFAGQK